MWHYATPYFAPKLTRLRQPDWLSAAVYSEAIQMPLQSGTYVETAAHVDPAGKAIAELPLDRTVLVDAIAIQLDAGKGARIERQALEDAVHRVCAPPYSGKALLVGTGWSDLWFEAEFVDGGPFFSDAAIDFVIQQEFGVLGGDFPRFDNPNAPTGHLYRLFASDAVLIAPLFGMAQLGNSTGRLIAAPLFIKNASATPVRAIWVPNAR
jgi:kynurenine formamidase